MRACWRGLSSLGTSSRPGAWVGRGEMPAVAMRPTGVSIGPTHGMARQGSRQRRARAKVMNRDMLLFELDHEACRHHFH